MSRFELVPQFESPEPQVCSTIFVSHFWQHQRNLRCDVVLFYRIETGHSHTTTESFGTDRNKAFFVIHYHEKSLRKRLFTVSPVVIDAPEHPFLLVLDPKSIIFKESPSFVG